MIYFLYIKRTLADPEFSNLCDFSSFPQLYSEMTNNLSNTASLYGGTRIPAGSDMHTYLMPGNYYCASYDDASSLANCPVGNAFKMEVSAPIANKTGTYLLQKYITHDGKATAIVAYDPYNQTWNTVKYLTKDDLDKKVNNGNSKSIGLFYNESNKVVHFQFDGVTVGYIDLRSI